MPAKVSKHPMPPTFGKAMLLIILIKHWQFVMSEHGQETLVQFIIQTLIIIKLNHMKLTSKGCWWNNNFLLSRKLAMLAGVPLALARNMPGAGPADLLILSMLTPPLAACNPEVVGSTPPPSIESKTVVFTVFFALQGCETQVKCTFLRFPGYHSIWVALIAFRYSMKKKVSSCARPPTWPCWLPFGGRFFFLVTFKLPFHALPLLSPHPASFRSFTPGASSWFKV